MSELLNQLRMIDPTKEMINLWYEVNFIRNIVQTIMDKNNLTMIQLTQENVENAREVAQKAVQSRFPLLKIKFEGTSTEETVKNEAIEPPVAENCNNPQPSE